jgi:hypothetical protein
MAIQWENLSAGALGILTSHNIDSRDTLTSSYHLLAESDVDVLVEEHVMDATDKEVWAIVTALTDAEMYDHMIYCLWYSVFYICYSQLA